METTTVIKTTDDFFEFLQEQASDKDCMNKIFRGERSSGYPLLPSIGRIKLPNGEKIDAGLEKEMLEDFKMRAYPYIKDFNFEESLELLSFGRHHGLPTRLLDWTQKLLVAVFFAVEKPFTDDELKNKEVEGSCVYIYDAERELTPCEPFDPFTMSSDKHYFPKHIDKRITAQGGLFMVHKDPFTPWEPKEGHLEKVIIQKDIREDIKRILNRLGINAATVYPDITGIAKFVEWWLTNEY